ncbi:MAG: PQQ-dependent sugar dehydrogenase [candidate division Zixibacteria bacterium]|nr:PQQ-dependent sugar dehydrogenase [candidate division Zixibacteria bacterium]
MKVTIAFAILSVTAALRAAPIPPGDLPNVRMVPAFPNLEFARPLCLVHANDSSGRLFVVEQQGRIHVFSGMSEVKKATAFRDLTGQVRTVDNEEGLLALVFHPQYRRNGYFFVYYSASDPLAMSGA